MIFEHQDSIGKDDLRPIIASSMDGFLLVDLAGNILEANESYSQLTGYSHDELLTMRVSSVDVFDSQEDVVRRMEKIIQEGSLRFETKNLHKNGSAIDVEISATYSPLHGGAIFSFIRDISQQKRSNEIMSARMRLMEYSLDHSFEDLLRATLDEAETLTGSCIGFYHTIDLDQQSLTLHAWSTRTADHFCKAEGSGSHYPISQAGVWIDCLREKRPVIHNDYASLPHRKGMPAGHAPVVRELVVPVFRGERIMAVLGVGNKSTDYDQQDIDLVSLLADFAWDMAEHKQAEDTIKQSEERYRDLIESSHDWIWEIDTTGIYTYASPQVRGILGYMPEEIIGKSPFDLMPEPEATRVRDIFSEILSHKRPFRRLKNANLHKDGRVIVLETSGVPFFDNQLSLLGYRGMDHDITDSTRIEEQLQISEKNYRYFTGLTSDFVHKCTRTGTNHFRIQWAGGGVQTILGYSIEEIYAAGCWIPFVHPDDRESVTTHLFSLTPGDCKTIEFRLINKQGETRWISETSTCTAGENEGELILFGSSKDITERKAVEDQLRMSEERHRTILLTAIDGYSLSDTHGRILEVNDAFCRMSGYSEEELLTMRIADLESTETADDLVEHMQMVMAQGYDCFESRQIRKDGSVLDVEHSVQYRAAEGGQFVGFVRDISTRKKTEIYRAMGQDILSVLNSSLGLQESMAQAIDTIKSATAVDAVGIRLQEGDDFPYFWQDGFSKEFLLKEHSLLVRNRDGGVCRDKQGNICLECTCGVVICGKTDPANSLFTRGGSAWTNDSFPLLDIPPDDEFRTNPRNECVHQNYASVALIPIRAKGQIVGLLQLNAHRKGCFTLQEIELLEGIAGNIGEAMLRKQAEDHLRQERDRAQSYLDTVETMIVVLDTEGRITTINRKACQLLGYEEAELLGRNWFDTCLPQPKGMEKVFPFFLRLINGDSAAFHEYREDPVMTRSGELRHIAWHNALLSDNQGQIVGTLSAGEDITKRKRAEAELHKLSQAIEQSPATIFITDLNGNLEYVNPAFCILTGYTAKEVLGKNPRLLKSGITSSAEYCRLWETITTGGIWHGEFCNRKKNGETYWERACIAPITDNEGKIKHFVAIKEDISQQKHEEQEKIKFESQFLQAQKMESVGRLAGGVAHDFNNILMTIQNYVYLCLMDSDETKQSFTFLKEIGKAVDRAVGLTRQLLAFARKQTISPQVIDLNDTVAGMLKMLQRLIGENIRLIWQPATNLWQVKLDPSQIDQILANLCVNARDAISDIGKIVIETTNQHIDDTYCTEPPYITPGEYVLLSVSDNGSGIDKETLAHIFEPFFTTKGIGEGTGLGLSTVYGIVKQNGGFIDVFSATGSGTTFLIYLPRYQGEDLRALQDGVEEPLVRGNETILLVEDDADILSTTAMMLENLGYSVLPAHNAGEAIQLAKEHDIHLLITDVIMPKMNGRELANNLASLYPQIKSLFMSGYTADIIARHGVLEQGVNFIQKPFSFPDIALRVRKLLDNK